ncbi:MAG: hypothetical protein M3463_16350 [Verrucomicrobiota bacterium]|nr:hypothetical protein [Verrucomicrobiota bacterium]
MRHDIYAMRKDPVREAEADKLLVGRGSSGPIVIEQKQWHHVAIQISGDQDAREPGRQTGRVFESPGIAHETKSSFHFTVNRQGVLFDDVRIWSAR